MAELLLINSDIPFLTEGSSTLSGVVTVDGAPAARIIGVFRDSVMAIIASTASDKTTGAWSIVVKSAPMDKFKIVCFGDPGENSQIFDYVSGA